MLYIFQQRVDSSCVTKYYTIINVIGLITVIRIMKGLFRD